MKYPESVQNLIHMFNRLPGIGPKSAERLVFHLLKKNSSEILEFSKALENLYNDVQYCPSCFNISQQSPCLICRNPDRDHSRICVVTKPQDLIAMEATNEYKGVYHVLWGSLSAIDGITPDKLKIRELVSRIEKNIINEIIFAFNTDIEGESTILYLTDLLKQYKVPMTRLAKGMPMGSEVEYADEITLSNAFSGRVGI